MAGDRMVMEVFVLSAWFGGRRGPDEKKVQEGKEREKNSNQN